MPRHVDDEFFFKYGIEHSGHTIKFVARTQNPQIMLSIFCYAMIAHD